MLYAKKVLTVEEVMKLNGDGKVNLTPRYQRDDAWDNKRRQQFILSILQGYDIPKIFFRETATQFEVIDGKQRLTTIIMFINELFDLPRGINPISDQDVSKKSFSELPETFKSLIMQFAIDITIYSDISDIETEEIFARLQLGAPLNAQEKRNASSTPIINFIRDVTGHTFFVDNVPLDNKRYVHSQIAIQSLLVFASGIATNTNTAAINRFLDSHRDLTYGDEIADNYKLVLTDFSKQFPYKSNSLVRNNIVPLFLMASKLQSEGLYGNYIQFVADWLAEFQARKEDEQNLPEYKKNAKWKHYLRALNNHTDSADSIRVRSEWMYKDFLDFANTLKTDPLFNEDLKN